MLADVATGDRHDRLAQVVAHYLSRWTPTGPNPTPPRAGRCHHHARRRRRSGRFDLDPVGGEKVETVLESFVQEEPAAPGDMRTRAQQLGDALVQWADVTLAAGHAPVLRTVKPHVFVTIGIDDLTDPATGPAAGTMGFGAQISAARARWLACDGRSAGSSWAPTGAS